MAQQPQGSYSKTELEDRRKEIMNSIRETEQQLEAIKKDKNATLGQLRALQNKLAVRQRLINNINDEIDQISSNIQTSASEVVILRQTLEQLRVQYAQSVRYAYSSRSSYGMLAFLFSSESFNDAMRRMKYLKKFREFRQQQAEQIRVTKSRVENKIGELNQQKVQKDELLTTQVQQKQVLEKESDETKHVVQELKGREKELLATIEKNKKAAHRLDKAISDIIHREIELARKKAEEEEKRKTALAATTTTTRPSGIKVTTTTSPNYVAPKTAAPTYSLSLTPEAIALSNNFQLNKGKLPWPVEKGFISEAFGRHHHPVAEKVIVENNGIEIQTSTGAVAYAIFDGVVSSVSYIPGMGQFVLLKHGDFFTVYSRLSGVTVKKGDQVKIRQSLGTVILNDDSVPAIHFEIWKSVANKEPVKMDPASWIAPLRQ